MIKTELYLQRLDGIKLYKTYSDKNVLIRKVGTNEEYVEAIDIENSGSEYEETDKPIESFEENDNEIKQLRIDQLKLNLKVTDYIAIKFAEGELTAEEYEETKLLRRQWREEINALEDNL